MCVVKETKDLYLNPLNKIKWGPDERSASDFAPILKAGSDGLGFGANIEFRKRHPD